MAGIETAEREAHWILEAAVGSPLTAAASSDPIGAKAWRRAVDLAERRASREPLQYLTGVAGFRRLELAVGPGVFIPRPETEIVVERALERLPHNGTVVDVGTGSGAIALAIADERRDATVLATEVSPEAITWARKNVEAIGSSVEIVRGDLFAGLPDALRGAVDVVVSNPPYVSQSETMLLPREVVDHEPHGALFADKDGMAVVERIAREARGWLRPGGWVVLEIGERQGAAVSSLLEALDYGDVSTSRDLNERDRVAEGTLESPTSGSSARNSRE